jgi:tRNA (adenine37-N6)-methyltransferase
MNIKIKSIGTVQVQYGRHSIHLKKQYIPGLKHIEGYSHLHIIWWAHLTDNTETRKRLIARNLFKNAPDQVGVFASRTPERPNPLMISTIKVDQINYEEGIITMPFIDAEAGTPVIDIKPYYPMERIRNCQTPACFEHWPKWAEDANNFDWKNEIRLDKN